MEENLSGPDFGKRKRQRNGRLIRFLRGWPRWGSAALGAILLAAAVPPFLQTRTIGWIETKGGILETEPGWISRLVPGATRAWLDANLGGPDWSRSIDRVTRVYLKGARIEDAELKKLAVLDDLEWLDLDDTPISDRGVRRLGGSTRLAWLDLDRTRVTDQGLAHLAGLSRLEGLSLQQTAVTDAGLAHLEGIPDLEQVHLDGTAVTADRAREFRSKHGTRIFR